MTESQGNIVTVLLIVYNQEEYLCQSIDSVLSQETDYKYELLINDDCSTDKSREIIDDYVKRYPDRIVASYNTHNLYQKGKVPFEDRTLKMITGKYVMLLEGDDYWTDNQKIQKQVSFLESAKGSQYVGCMARHYIMDCRYGRILPSSKCRDIDVDRRKWLAGAQECFNPLTYCVNAEVFKSIFSFAIKNDLQYTDGTLCFLMLVIGDGKFRVLKDYMAVYRSGSSDHNYNSTDINRRVMNWVRTYERIDELTGFIYHNDISRIINNGICEINGYTFKNLLFNVGPRHHFSRYGFWQKITTLYRLIIRRKPVDQYGYSMKSVIQQRKEDVKREIYGNNSFGR